MEIVDLLNQTRVIWHEELARGPNSFIFTKALLPPSPKSRIIMATTFVSMSYRGS